MRQSRGSAMRNVLDDPVRIAGVDKNDMMTSIFRFPEPLLDPPGIDSATTRKIERADGLILSGMGGSASAGDVLLDWLGKGLGVPAQVLRQPDIPSFVTRRTVVVCVSFSGETWETLNVFRQAVRNGCM